MEYYSAIKNEDLEFDRKWTNMEDLLLSEAVRLLERHCMSPLNIYQLSALYGRDRKTGEHKSIKNCNGH